MIFLFIWLYCYCYCYLIVSIFSNRSAVWMSRNIRFENHHGKHFASLLWRLIEVNFRVIQLSEKVPQSFLWILLLSCFFSFNVSCLISLLSSLIWIVMFLILATVAVVYVKIAATKNLWSQAWFWTLDLLRLMFLSFLRLYRKIILKVQLFTYVLSSIFLWSKNI